MPFQNGTALDDEARMADRLAVEATYTGCHQHGDREPSPVGCGLFTIILSTPVYNYVDS